MNDDSDTTKASQHYEETLDPDVRSVELDGEDGEKIVIAQQSVGPGSRIGDGEFPDPETPPTTPDERAAEQEQLQHDNPV